MTGRGRGSVGGSGSRNDEQAIVGTKGDLEAWAESFAGDALRYILDLGAEYTIEHMPTGLSFDAVYSDDGGAFSDHFRYNFTKF